MIEAFACFVCFVGSKEHHPPKVAMRWLGVSPLDGSHLNNVRVGAGHGAVVGPHAVTIALCVTWLFPNAGTSLSLRSNSSSCPLRTPYTCI